MYSPKFMAYTPSTETVIVPGRITLSVARNRSSVGVVTVTFRTTDTSLLTLWMRSAWVSSLNTLRPLSLSRSITAALARSARPSRLIDGSCLKLALNKEEFQLD